MVAILVVAKWFLLLMFYSFIGWVYESIVCSIEEKRLINRGFLNGPICPVYGFGGLLVITLLYNRIDNVLLLFLGCMLLTTTLEYITAIILEKMFDARWWDYSSYPLNFQGRICLLGAVVFGVLATLTLRYLHPFTLQILESMQEWIVLSVAGVLVLLVSIDIFVTVRHLLRLNGRLQTIQQQVNQFMDKQMKRAEGLKSTLLERFEESEFYTEQVKRLFDLGKRQNMRLLRAFPKLRPIHNNEAWQWLKSKLLSKDK